MPTLLAAVGTSPDPAYPSDGEDLGQVLSGSAGPHPRKLCWRYKAGSQRAIRDGDRKYLRIAGNEFLFDVVRDPRERANLKDREKDVFERLKSDWEAWDATMLPERSRPASFTRTRQLRCRPLMASLTRRQRPHRQVPPRSGSIMEECAAIIRRGDRTMVGLVLENRSPLRVTSDKTHIVHNEIPLLP